MVIDEKRQASLTVRLRWEHEPGLAFLGLGVDAAFAAEDAVIDGAFSRLRRVGALGLVVAAALVRVSYCKSPAVAVFAGAINKQIERLVRRQAGQLKFNLLGGAAGNPTRLDQLLGVHLQAIRIGAGG